MSDVSWARVEREVWSRLDTEASGAIRRVPPARPVWPWLAVAVAAAAVAVVVVAVTRNPSSRPEAARDDQVARVVTATSPSTIAFGDVHLTLAEETAVMFDRDPRKPSAIVERGSTWFEVAPRAGRPRFVVHAGDATIEVIGTRFRVARTGERIDVEVDHGIVGVAYHGTTVQLAAHDRWSSEIAAIPASPASPASPVPIPTPKPTPAVKPIAPRGGSDADRARFEQLSALEVHDPDAAITGYLALAGHTSAWSELALFAAGRLASDRHDPRAEPLLASYLRRFPSGANATDARQLLARLKGHP